MREDWKALPLNRHCDICGCMDLANGGTGNVCKCVDEQCANMQAGSMGRLTGPGEVIDSLSTT